MGFVVNRNFRSDFERKQAVAISAAGEFYLRQMATTLSNSPPRTGRAYEFRKGRLSPIPSVEWQADHPRAIRVHIASAPGEPPALLTGKLRQARSSALRREGADLVMFFGSNVPYSKRLETEMDRPAWVPTWLAAKPTLGAVFADAFKRAA